jgi:hypothetical protein
MLSIASLALQRLQVQQRLRPSVYVCVWLGLVAEAKAKVK